MTTRNTIAAPSGTARTTGALYLMIVVLGIWSEVFVRSALVAPGDAATTAANILGSNGAIHLSFAADLLMAVCDVAVAVLLYVLLRPVGRTLALVAAAFRLTQTAVIAANLLNQFGAIRLLFAPEYMEGLGKEIVEWQALLMIDIQGHGYDLGLVFFGVSCIALGVLIARSGYMPKLLGLLVATSGLVYIAGSAARFLAPDYLAMIEPLYLVPLASELSLALYLLLRGLNPVAWQQRQAALA